MKYLIKKSLVFVVLFTTLLVNANEISSLRNLNDEKTTVLTVWIFGRAVSEETRKTLLNLGYAQFSRKIKGFLLVQFRSNTILSRYRKKS